MIRPKEAGALAAGGALLAAFAVGQAIQVSNGAGSPDAYRDIGIALAALVAAIFLGRKAIDFSPRVNQAVLLVGAAGVLWQVMQVSSTPPAIYLRGASLFDFLVRMSVFGALAVSALSEKPLLGRWHVPAAVVTFWWTSAWILKFSPEPVIDVFTWTNEAIAQFKLGLTPYDMKFHNIYHHTRWYGADADNDWVYGGYPYPPMSLMLSMAGSWFGDVRWANLAALAFVPLAFLGGKGRFAALAGMLYVTTPRVFFMLEQSWTDDFLVALVALTLLCAVRFPKLTPFALGAAISTKQYMIFLLPLVPMLFEEKWTWRDIGIFVGKLVATGALINLPFFLMGPHAFIKSMTGGDFVFRPDALSFLAATSVNGQPTWPTWLQLPLMLPIYVLAWWKGPRGPAGFALASAAIICTFFSFSRHAFCNHHFLTLGFACLALGFIGATSEKKVLGKA